MMGFDIDKLAKQITSPFLGKLDRVADNLDIANHQIKALHQEQLQTNELLETLIRIERAKEDG